MTASTLWNLQKTLLCIARIFLWFQLNCCKLGESWCCIRFYQSLGCQWGVGRPHTNMSLWSIHCVSKSYVHFILHYELPWKRGKVFHLILKKGSNWCKEKLIVKEICIWIKARQFFKTVLALIHFWSFLKQSLFKAMRKESWGRKAAQRHNVFSLRGERCFANLRRDKSPWLLKPAVTLCLKCFLHYQNKLCLNLFQHLSLGQQNQGDTVRNNCLLVTKYLICDLICSSTWNFVACFFLHVDSLASPDL